MAIGIFAQVRILPGHEAAYEEAFARQTEMVRKHEPGNSLYRLFRSADDPGLYSVMEIYDDEEALRFHSEGPHLQETRPHLWPHFDGEPILTRYESV